MAKIWRNRIEDKTQFFDDCPNKYKQDVLNLMRQDVVDDIITKEEFYELTGIYYEE